MVARVAKKGNISDIKNAAYIIWEDILRASDNPIPITSDFYEPTYDETYLELYKIARETVKGTGSFCRIAIRCETLKPSEQCNYRVNEMKKLISFGIQKFNNFPVALRGILAYIKKNELRIHTVYVYDHVVVPGGERDYILSVTV